MIEGLFVEGLIYGIMALGVFFTFRILDFPDLTVDGSFPLGAVIMAMAMVSGMNLWFALCLAFAGGVTAGAVTAVIHNKLKVPHLLAGILTMTMLYSVNIRILGNRANLALMRQETLLSKAVLLMKGMVSNEVSVLLFFICVVLDEHTAALDPRNAGIVLGLTRDFVTQYNLTTLMVTHNMQHAIDYGNRLLMMDSGEVVIDVAGEEKKKLTVEALIAMFSRVRKNIFAHDEALLTKV
ncbi:MAG: hypothetical protein KKD44_02480 [Proteobacteria bacterium]|nr:hypothetical protein [Pseudomonadota bacterium]